MKIECRIKGGLGNQLFMYSAARRLALKNNALLILDVKSGFEKDFTYKRSYQLDKFAIKCEIKKEVHSFKMIYMIYRFFRKNANKIYSFNQRSYIIQRGNDYDPRLLKLKINGDICLEGYWQSESYFKDVESVIRSDLVITPPTDLVNISLSKKINCHKSVAVHVRFFDDPRYYSNNNMSVEYYRKALKVISNKVSDAHYFLFSDYPQMAFELLKMSNSKCTVVSNNVGNENAYADLWLMSLCKDFIIANSTFSWWAAWLSSNNSKCVVAPANVICHGKMAWGFDGLFPNSWIQI